MAEYIERETIIEQLERNLVASKPGSWEELCYHDAINYVKGIPAADVARVRHGRWFVNGYVCGETEYQCSECKETEWRTSSSRLKFCPFCGAKMDLEV